jgi:hypothetical protein
MLYPNAVIESIDTLVAEVSRRVLSEEFQRNLEFMGTVQVAMDMCTVAVDPGRRSGKSSYIQCRARRDSIVIVPNRHLLRYSSGNYITLTAEELLTDSYRLKGLRPSTVYVDEPALVFKTISKYDLYEKMCRADNIPLFVLLGRCS